MKHHPITNKMIACIFLVHSTWLILGAGAAEMQEKRVSKGTRIKMMVIMMVLEVVMLVLEVVVVRGADDD